MLGSAGKRESSIFKNYRLYNNMVYLGNHIWGGVSEVFAIGETVVDSDLILIL